MGQFLWRTRRQAPPEEPSQSGPPATKSVKSDGPVTIINLVLPPPPPHPVKPQAHSPPARPRTPPKTRSQKAIDAPRNQEDKAEIGAIQKIEAAPKSPLGAKTIDTASDIHEPTQNFILLTNRKAAAQETASKSPSGASSLQPVDAISASKSASDGRRRVYKVVRVAPSKFLTRKEKQAAAEAAAAVAAQKSPAVEPGRPARSKSNKQP